MTCTQTSLSLVQIRLSSPQWWRALSFNLLCEGSGCVECGERLWLHLCILAEKRHPLVSFTKSTSVKPVWRRVQTQHKNKMSCSVSGCRLPGTKIFEFFLMVTFGTLRKFAEIVYRRLQSSMKALMSIWKSYFLTGLGKLWAILESLCWFLNGKSKTWLSGADWKEANWRCAVVSTTFHRGSIDSWKTKSDWLSLKSSSIFVRLSAAQWILTTQSSPSSVKRTLSWLWICPLNIHSAIYWSQGKTGDTTRQAVTFKNQVTN